MSVALDQTRDIYKKTICTEFILLLVFFITVGLWQLNYAVSFSLGFVASFLPYCLFVFVMFFRGNYYQHLGKTTKFYQGEGLKILTTVILIVVIFKTYLKISFMSFFVGYFLALFLNNILPIYLSGKIRKVNV